MDYSGIPACHCPTGCAKCCGPILWNEEEDQAIRAYLRKRGGTMPRGHGVYCPFLQVGKHRCSIYPVRPLVCRLYGVTRTLTCEVGHRVERWLSGAEAAALMQQYEGATFRSAWDDGPITLADLRISALAADDGIRSRIEPGCRSETI